MPMALVVKRQGDEVVNRREAEKSHSGAYASCLLSSLSASASVALTLVTSGDLASGGAGAVSVSVSVSTFSSPSDSTAQHPSSIAPANARERSLHFRRQGQHEVDGAYSRRYDSGSGPEGLCGPSRMCERRGGAHNRHTAGSPLSLSSSSSSSSSASAYSQPFCSDVEGSTSAVYRRAERRCRATAPSAANASEWQGRVGEHRLPRRLLAAAAMAANAVAVSCLLSSIALIDLYNFTWRTSSFGGSIGLRLGGGGGGGLNGGLWECQR